MGLSRKASARHTTAGVDPTLYADFAVGDRVDTVDGFLGTVTAVEDGPFPSTEQYQVTLDDGMGGGTYSSDQLTKVVGTTAAVSEATHVEAKPVEATGHHVASDDYPELAEILVSRPPLPHSEPMQMRASKTATPDEANDRCSACGGSGEQGTGHECYICDGSGLASEEKASREAGVTNDNPANGLPVGLDLASGQQPVTAAVDWDQAYEAYWCEECGFKGTLPPSTNGLDVCPSCGNVEKALDIDGNPFQFGLAASLRTEAGAIPPLPDWAVLQQFTQYPQSGPEGISYFKGEIDPTTHVDCLLYFKDGQLVGVLNHFPQDMGPERKGNVLLMVHPAHRRMGIGSALWKEAKKRWNVKAQGQDQTPDGSAFIRTVGSLQEAEEHVFFATAGLFDRVLDLLDTQMAPEDRVRPGTSNTLDWCRFRKNERCFFPKTLNEKATEQAGYAVWNPEDRGRCPRQSWDLQMKCPVGEPGPLSGDPQARVDATVRWEDGGQRLPPGWEISDERYRRNASLQKQAAFEFTAAWSDVRAKAKRIRSEGGVRIISAPRPGDDSLTITAEVKGDNHTYETTLLREPGKRNVASWSCGCAWASYSWGRTGPWRKFEGRMCSHALAVQYEAQAQGMNGRQVKEQPESPSWRGDPFHYTKPPRAGDHARAASLRPVCLDGDLAEAPAVLLARHAKVMKFRDLKALVRGGIRRVQLVVGQVGAALVEGLGKVPTEEVLYPTWHPSLGLSLSHTAAKAEFWSKTDEGRSYNRSFVGKNGRTYFVKINPYFDNIEAFTEGPHQVVGGMHVWESPFTRKREIHQVFVKPQHRRQGVASAMLSLVREQWPETTHSDALSEDGKAWAEKVAHVVDGRDGEHIPGTDRHYPYDEQWADPSSWGRNHFALIGDDLFLFEQGGVELEQGNPETAASWVAPVTAERIDIGTGRDVPFGELGWADSDQLPVTRITEDDPVDFYDPLAYTETQVPEPALPFTEGEIEAEGGLHSEALVVEALADPTTAPEMAEAIGESLASSPPSPGDPRLAWLLSGASAGAASGAGGGTPANASDSDIAAQAKAHLAKIALKEFTPAEQREIIEEGMDVLAANLGDLDIAGTHYQGLEAAFQQAEAVGDEEDLW